MKTPLPNFNGNGGLFYWCVAAAVTICQFLDAVDATALVP